MLASAARHPVAYRAPRDLPLYTAPQRPDPAVYLRRQIAALVLAAIVLAVVAMGLRSAVGTLTAVPASGREGATASIDSPAARTANGGTYVVQRGDTLWTIARAIQPSGDPAPLVRALTKANGGASLDVGDLIVVPASAR